MPHRTINAQLRGRAKHLRREMTTAERRFWAKLRGHRFNGRAFRRQVPLGRYIGDFVCFSRRVVIEVDGATHSTPAEAADDLKREDWLKRQGFRIRYQNIDVMQIIEGVLSDIESALAEHPPLQLSPARGRVHSEFPGILT
jgi:very-short-patch-repair endonuclease